MADIERETEDSQIHVLNLLEKFNSGSDGHEDESDSEEAMLEGCEKLSAFCFGANHAGFVGY